MRRLAIIGGGAWGTALAIVARRAGSIPVLWARDPDVVATINERHENPLFLPGMRLDPAIAATADIAAAIAGAEAALLAVPAQFLRGVLERLAPDLPADDAACCIAPRGSRPARSRRCRRSPAEFCPTAPLAVLSGPSFAAEVARDLPTAVTIASRDPSLGRAFMTALGSSRFRPYLSRGPDRRRNRRGGQERAGDRLRHRRRPRPGRQCPGRADHPRARRDDPAGRSQGRPSRNLPAASPVSAISC